MSSEPKMKWMPLLIGASNVVGAIVMLFLANKWSNYLSTLHENELWFSNIKEVEREISFRTEQGLYYSYFKHLVNAPSLWEGKASLERDNLTEHLNTINIFQRFNIHQELFLAALYKIYDFHMGPIFFYVEAVFSLQGFFLCALYLIAWKLSGTWVCGVLSTVFIVVYRHEVTRVGMTISLREHFSLPFIFAQFAAIDHYLTVFSPKTKSKSNFNEKIHLVLIFLLTLVFNITWQFAQFVLLPQSVVLLILGTIQILDKDQVCRILFVNLMSMLSVWYLQFYQPMVLNSFVVSFIPVAIASLQSQSENRKRKEDAKIISNLIFSILRTLTVLILAAILNFLLKFSLGQSDDDHIFTFVKSKLGFTDESNFETRLYLCLPAFQAIDLDFYIRMSYRLLLPLYLIYVVSRSVFITSTVFAKWSSLPHDEVVLRKKDDDYVKNTGNTRPSTAKSNGNGSQSQTVPELSEEDFSNPLVNMDARPAECFHICQSLLFGVMAMTTYRMKCFWSPYICIMASVMICDSDLWGFIADKLANAGQAKEPSTAKTGPLNKDSHGKSSAISGVLRHLVLIFVMVMVVQSHKDDIYKELEDLKEFYDPDTVDLMEWITASTPPTAAFTGSMQLLAGVRLSTWRPITNHPHFEDKALRDRTKELYSIYAKVSPEEVHRILVKYNSSYIILEDSICLAAGRRKDRCSLPDTMDLTLGHVPDDGIIDPPDLVPSRHKRFCHEIRYGAAPYRKLFRKVFENKTFRIYKVKPADGTFD